MSDSLLRQVPAVHRVLAHPALEPFLTEQGVDGVTQAIRAELDALRQAIIQGTASLPDCHPDVICGRLITRLQQANQLRFRRVINATGIILHTNLGRSVLCPEALEAIVMAGSGYLNLELDLATGQRSSRQDFIRELCTELTGAESATVVNNCAAATVIVLRALAMGREVIVSRGQLIEIGGSFRIPDVMQVSGAQLREVGTTNITRLSDYENAIGPNTAALMLIHPSNYRVRGFTQSVALEELVALGRKCNIPVIDDCGSGAMIDLSPYGLTDEPIIPERVALGADIVLFSGDKLLGGPQSGLILGKKKWIEKIERDPLMRALRLDKLTLAALEATLQQYRNRRTVTQLVPTLRMITLQERESHERVERVTAAIQEINDLLSVRIDDDQTYIGGGSVPDQAFSARLICIRAQTMSENDLAMRLREQNPAIMGRLRQGEFCLDLRTVLLNQETSLVDGIRGCIRMGTPTI